MTKPLDLKGKTFSRLKVISRAGKDKYKKILWNCVCECGNKIQVSTSSLNSGNTKSCGCLVKANSGNKKGYKPVQNTGAKSQLNDDKIDLKRRRNCIYAMEICCFKYDDMRNLPCKGCNRFKQLDFTTDVYSTRHDYSERARHGGIIFV